jgi:thiamine-phosphate pyrophosphorylase
MHFKNLKKYYFINKFDPTHIKKLNKDVSIIYRKYTSKIDENLIFKIKNFCKKDGRKFFLSNNFKLAIKLDLDGVYLPSFNKKHNHQTYWRRKNFLILGSAHNIKEIKEKERQQVDIIFISSLFKNKKTFLGLNKFNILSKHTKSKVVALGGINRKNFSKLKLLNIFGFAGISFFDVKKNGP